MLYLCQKIPGLKKPDLNFGLKLFYFPDLELDFKYNFGEGLELGLKYFFSGIGNSLSLTYDLGERQPPAVGEEDGDTARPQRFNEAEGAKPPASRDEAERRV